jgi:hypothetical protein
MSVSATSASSNALCPVRTLRTLAGLDDLVDEVYQGLSPSSRAYGIIQVYPVHLRLASTSIVKLQETHDSVYRTSMHAMDPLTAHLWN